MAALADWGSGLVAPMALARCSSSIPIPSQSTVCSRRVPRDALDAHDRDGSRRGSRKPLAQHDSSSAPRRASAMTGVASGTLQANLITDDPNGIQLTNSSPSLIGNTIRNTTRGIQLSGSSSPLIQGGNLFSNNATAIQIEGAFGAGARRPVVNGNDFLTNTANLRLLNFANGQGPSLDLRSNYFGTTSAAQIRDSIVLDDSSGPGSTQPVPVDFSGYLDRLRGPIPRRCPCPAPPPPSAT